MSSFTARKAPAIGQNEALVSVYLAVTGSAMKNISFNIEEIAFNEGGGQWFSLPFEPSRIDMARLADRQALLGGTVVPSGTYTHLRFRITNVQVDGKKQELPEEKGNIVLSFPVTVSLTEGDSTCFFIDWHLSESLTNEGVFEPRFSARGQEEPLAGELLYIVCDDIDTLYLARADNHFIVASVGLPGPLGEMRIDEDRKRIYVLSPGKRLLYVLDSTNCQRIDQIYMPLVLKPHFMALSGDGSFAFVTDAQTNQVLKIDLENGSLDEQVNVGYQPERIIYFEQNGVGRLAVSSPGSQEVLILNAENLGTVRVLSVGFEPSGLLFLDDLLYVGAYGGHSVTAYSVQDGNLKARIPVGTEPVPILFDGGDRVYIGNYLDNSLSVVIPGQYVSLRELPIGPTPFAMALFQNRQMVYIANREARKVTVMDLAAEKITTNIPLVGSPFSLDIRE